jgi:hypothetical protein
MPPALTWVLIDASHHERRCYTVGNKLEDFRLLNYEERSRLLTALALYEARYSKDEESDALIRRLSHTECQHGGCPYCNADRAREEAEYQDMVDASD